MTDTTDLQVPRNNVKATAGTTLTLRADDAHADVSWWTGGSDDDADDFDDATEHTATVADGYAVWTIPVPSNRGSTYLRATVADSLASVGRLYGSELGAPDAVDEVTLTVGTNDVTFTLLGGGGGVSLPIATSDVTGLDLALAGKQPVDADLTAIAALTTTAFGRSLLTAADASAVRALVDAATPAQVAAAVAALVDSAPAALDTLNELAAALGDDPNFATTVTNALAGKANSADLADVATSGTAGDLTATPGGVLNPATRETTLAGYLTALGSTDPEGQAASAAALLGAFAAGDLDDQAGLNADLDTLGGLGLAMAGLTLNLLLGSGYVTEEELDAALAAGGPASALNAAALATYYDGPYLDLGRLSADAAHLDGAFQSSEQWPADGTGWDLRWLGYPIDDQGEQQFGEILTVQESASPGDDAMEVAYRWSEQAGASRVFVEEDETHFLTETGPPCPASWAWYRVVRDTDGFRTQRRVFDADAADEATANGWLWATTGTLAAASSPALTSTDPMVTGAGYGRHHLARLELRALDADLDADPDPIDGTLLAGFDAADATTSTTVPDLVTGTWTAVDHATVIEP